jgi:hypothetical protein
MANGLADLNAPVEYRILILNILRGLNQRFEYVGSIIWRYSPFLNFLNVRDDLLLEEIHMNSTGHPAAPAAKPQCSTPSRPPNGENGGTDGNRNKYNKKNRNSGNDDDNNGKNSNGGEGRGGSSGQTTAPTGSDGKTDASWPIYGHPYVATFHKTSTDLDRSHRSREKGLPTQSTARRLTDPRVHTQLLFRGSQ